MSSPQREKNTWSINDHSREKIRKELKTALSNGFDRRNPRYSEIISLSDLPIRFLHEQIFSSERPFAILKNLPIDTLSNEWEIGPAPIAEALLVGITQALGLHHFGYPEEKNGEILQDVFPISGLENTLSNAGRIKFNLHVESPFLPRIARPEAAALLALNNEAKTATRIAIVEEINSQLPKETVETLCQPYFTYRQDDSFSTNRYTLHTPPSPFLKKIDGLSESRCAIYTITNNMQAERALNAWMEVAEASALNIVLKPGELLIFNNYRCVHGRGSVEGRRWLKRIYGSRHCPLADKNDMVSIWNAISTHQTEHSF